MKSLLHLTVIVFFLTSNLFAQNLQKVDLNGAISYALSNNIAIKNAQLNIADAEQQIIERRAIGLPTVNGSVGYQRYLEIPQQPLPEAFIDPNNPDAPTSVSFFRKNNINAGLNLETMVFDGSYFVGLRAARTYRRYVQQELLTKERDVKNNVINAYLPALLLKENMAILDKNIANLEKLLGETKALYQEGFVEQLDLDRQQLSLLNLKTSRSNLDRQMENAKTALKFAMGFPMEHKIEIVGSLEEMDAILNDTGINETYLPENRPELGLLDIGYELNELNLKNYKSQYLPSLRANAAYLYQYQGDDFTNGFWAPQAYVGLNLNVPIFDGLDKRAKIQRTMLDMQEVENQKTELLQGIELEVRTARTSYLSARENHENLKKNLELAERIYNTTQIKYKEGVGASLEVTQAEQELYTSQGNYLQSLYELVLAKKQLEIALGK